MNKRPRKNSNNSHLFWHKIAQSITPGMFCALRQIVIVYGKAHTVIFTVAPPIYCEPLLGQLSMCLRNTKLNNCKGKIKIQPAFDLN
ncbi:hypothetical protein [Vulcanisaeta souniana]|uniref:hypothetical protein n=1 Tax=Vulcanisaeta souniana TaxID=164452 RepID=UPI00223153BA|nr:hypothetical protein [Vulcanisaeta souniana]